MSTHHAPALRRLSVGIFAAIAIQALALGQAQAITVDLQVKSTSSATYTTDVVIKNDTSTAINGWTLTFKLGNTIKSFYSATKSGSDPYTWKNVSFNGAIAVGKTQSFGFTANGTLNGANMGGCTINGLACTLLIGGSPIGGASSSAASSKAASSVAASSKASSAAASSKASSAAASSKASSAAASSTPASSSSSSTAGVVRYRQTFDTLATGALWKNNLDSAKPKAHPENALVTASCGTGGSTCLRIVYRQSDGIHKQPPSSPVFVTASGVINWTPSDAGHSNTATDVLQANLPIDGKTDGSSKDSNAAVPAKAYTLSYDVYFEPGFDFAKGGKLPGLAAAAFDSGCTEDGNAKRSGTNWSERIMWRANGRVELYSYDQTRPSGSCGINKMIDQVAGDPPYEVPGQIPNDSKFRFKPGIWYTIRLSVKMNDNNANVYQRDGSGALVRDANGDPIPLSGNGEVSLAIKSADGATKRLMVYTNVALRDECNGPCSGTPPDTKATWVNALFFSTFHGGNETKRLTCIDLSKSTMTNVVQKAMPSYSGLTQARFDQLCASQINVPIFPILTWNPLRLTAARYDNMVVTEGYTAQAF
ncbi:MAG: hypothetical protein JWL63_2530 [Rhodocyclales bacterium]|nr:hypothetical protein [Rhodocyclales bacterium]